MAATAMPGMLGGCRTQRNHACSSAAFAVCNSMDDHWMSSTGINGQNTPRIAPPKRICRQCAWTLGCSAFEIGKGATCLTTRLSVHPVIHMTQFLGKWGFRSGDYLPLPNAVPVGSQMVAMVGSTGPATADKTLRVAAVWHQRAGYFQVTQHRIAGMARPIITWLSSATGSGFLACGVTL